MKVNSDDIIFDAIIKKAAEQNIDQLNDYGENDPFTETPEFEKMANEAYACVKKNIKKKQKKKKGLRFIAVVAAVMTLILVTLSVNASAFSIFLYKTYLDVRGDILRIRTDSEYINEQYSVIKNYKLKGEMLVPGWLPNGTQLKKIEDKSYSVCMKYEYNGMKISFTQETIPDETDNLLEQMFLERSDYHYEENYVDGLSVYIVTIQGDIGNTCYSAFWNSNSVIYSLDVYDNELLLKAILSSLKQL